MASLFVIQGADQGKRFEFRDATVPLGRDRGNAVCLHDHEVSRRHAELRLEADGYRVVDVGSANGTFVNGEPATGSALRPGDQLRIGQTLMLFGDSAGADRDPADHVDLLARASPLDRSAIVRSLPADEATRALRDAPGAAELGVLYRATRAVSQILDPDALLPRILALAAESIAADRAAILLGDAGEPLTPRAVHLGGRAGPDERMPISTTIVEHVRGRGEGVITSDAPTDSRFAAAASVREFGIREALCVPVRGRHGVLGVLYADTLTNAAQAMAAGSSGQPRLRFTEGHLALMVALGSQAGLAIENTRLYEAKLQAERLAAVGQTIATLSHHIKNILQGIKGGSYLIDMGLNQKDEAVVRRGWTIVEKNQTRIYNLVMDMLSFSKEREPALEPADLNEVVGEVVELMRARAAELEVALDWSPAAELPELSIDPEGIHRAVLNLVTNALDAAEGREAARVAVATGWDEATAVATVAVEDNGPGIAAEKVATIFEVFASTKGSGGTGLGLPVSRKIAREHGGEVRLRSTPGAGSRFVVELPARRGEPRGTVAETPTLE